MREQVTTGERRRGHCQKLILSPGVITDILTAERIGVGKSLDRITSGPVNRCNVTFGLCMRDDRELGREERADRHQLH